MRILIVSDTHGKLSTLDDIVENNNFDRIIHCGDSEVPNLFHPAEIVRGNSYLDPNYPLEKIININGVRVLITHGHRYDVYNGIQKLMYKALQETVNIVCFGHTHIPLILEEEGILFINPGSLSRPRGGKQASYMVLEINEKIIVKHYNILNEELKEYERSK